MRWPYHPLVWVLLILLALVAQTALLPWFFPPGYTPDVVAALVVALGLFESPRRALWLGLLAGGLQDLLAGRAWGLNTVTLALLGWAAARAGGVLAKDRVFVPGLIGGLAQALLAPVDWVLLRPFGLAPTWPLFALPLPVWVLSAMFLTPGLVGLLVPARAAGIEVPVRGAPRRRLPM
ncbi:Rod shape-determining protein MreD [Candidatus Hydrogenisulfobacillus filiaventi]|uniref:Rod shape-determining protein MreD n=1 Tax=Candidatus Hydrogenisulfobacillus filiaventi TaxID=2707344 RepID=A0A6F8ZJB4_9FIRM|nr:rod shape-determining protein MreD [Bacillota bacterium]CAB1129680.1 Rod shape-determining protein MreD [Candidatus Hydrogenisulfobacillus filiaventi]